MENEKKINKKIVYSIVAIFIIIGIIVGATYAYFSARSNTERQTVTTAKMELEITPKDLEYSGISSNRKEINTTNRSYLEFNYTGSFGRVGYYTMTPGAENRWNILSVETCCPNGTTPNEAGTCTPTGSAIQDVSYISIDEVFDYWSAQVKPVINIKPDAVISSGNGTYASPYVIEY